MISLVLSMLSVHGFAHAQLAQFEVNQFRPSESVREGFAISSADDLGHLRLDVQLYLDYADDPLTFTNPSGSLVQLIHTQLTGHLQISLGLWERLVVFAGLPYHFIVKEDSTDSFGPIAVFRPDGGGLGDMWLGTRVRLAGTSKDRAQLALQGTLNFHTASALDGDQKFLGGANNSPRIGGHPELLATFNGPRLRVSLNLGVRLRQNLTIVNLKLGDELTYGIGGVIGAIQGKHALDVILDIFGRMGLSSSAKKASPMEILTGLKYHHQNTGLSLGTGFGIGVIDGYGAPDYRVIAMLGYASSKQKSRGSKGGLGDRDGDGIADTGDLCPKEAEDVDGYQDVDGCPDLDNDNDGVPDKKDKAPQDPEDRDGFQDKDGVPDLDNDDDGIPDIEDRCPNEMGSPILGGCPIYDRDGDNVLDHIDNCPDEAGPASNQGCRRKQLVEIQGGKLRIHDKVYFRSGSHQILAKSFGLLNNVAAVLKAHPEIKLVQVEGHTDEQGNPNYNMRLSQRRAQSVVDYLVRKRGIAASRLVAKGFGATQLIVHGAKTQANHAVNRRVEFKILKGR